MAEEHDKQADEAERRADDLEQQSDKLGDDIKDTRADFESKLGDVTAPGLLEEAAAAPGGKGVEDEDDERVDEDARENADAQDGGPA